MFSKYRKLGDITILCFVYYVLIFAIIFWVLTLINMAFNKKKNHFFKKKYYECGFGSLSDINISININFLLIGVFLILYDIEFTFKFNFKIKIFFPCFFCESKNARICTSQDSCNLVWNFGNFHHNLIGGSVLPPPLLFE